MPIIMSLAVGFGASIVLTRLTMLRNNLYNYNIATGETIDTTAAGRH